MFAHTLACHALGTTFESLPKDVVQDVKLRLIDTLSCAVAGAAQPGNLGVLELYRSSGGNGQATVISHGDKLPVDRAAMLNSLNCRAFDFEVTGPEAEGANAGKMVGHVCSTTEPTAFSVGEFMMASGKDLIAAAAVGGDIGARIAVADKFDFDRNFEVCGTANAIGATALAARLLGADEDQLVNAFGIVVNMIGGSYQSLWDGVDSFKLPGAMAAQNAVLAVQMAMKGFSGLKDPFESPLGYFGMFGNDSRPDMALLDIGERFYSKGMHKLHPSCYGNHNPIDSALDLVSQHEIDFAAIERITLDVPTNRVKHFLNQPVRLVDHQARSLFSIPYGIANAVMRRSVEIEHYTDDMIREPALLALTEKVTLVPSLPVGNNQASQLTIFMKDGRSFSTAREVPKGWAENPVGEAEVVKKFWRNIAFARTVTSEQAQRALDMLLNLEDVEDISPIAKCLSG